eukprot:6186914-Pleurochrysis_carterae.AAC.4
MPMLMRRKRVQTVSVPPSSRPEVEMRPRIDSSISSGVGGGRRGTETGSPLRKMISRTPWNCTRAISSEAAAVAGPSGSPGFGLTPVDEDDSWVFERRTTSAANWLSREMPFWFGIGRSGGSEEHIFRLPWRWR